MRHSAYCIALLALVGCSSIPSDEELAKIRDIAKAEGFVGIVFGEGAEVAACVEAHDVTETQAQLVFEVAPPSQYPHYWQGKVTLSVKRKSLTDAWQITKAVCEPAISFVALPDYDSAGKAFWNLSPSFSPKVLPPVLQSLPHWKAVHEAPAQP